LDYTFWVSPPDLDSLRIFPSSFKEASKVARYEKAKESPDAVKSSDKPAKGNKSKFSKPKKKGQVAAKVARFEENIQIRKDADLVEQYTSLPFLLDSFLSLNRNLQRCILRIVSAAFPCALGMIAISAGHDDELVGASVISVACLVLLSIEVLVIIYLDRVIFRPPQQETWSDDPFLDEKDIIRRFAKNKITDILGDATKNCVIIKNTTRSAMDDIFQNAISSLLELEESRRLAEKQEVADVLDEIISYMEVEMKDLIFSPPVDIKAELILQDYSDNENKEEEEDDVVSETGEKIHDDKSEGSDVNGSKDHKVK